MYEEVTAKVNKDVIKSISFYPDSWATKLRITLREVDVKNEIIIQGLELFGKSVAFEDEGGVLDKIIVTDAHPEWDLEVLKSVFSEYGDIVRCEREFYYEEGQRTIVETGKIFVFAAAIRTPIPRKLSIMAENRFHQVNVWYKRQNEVHTKTPRCPYCGLEHAAVDCPHKKMVCYLCQESGHDSRGCPNNKGCRKDDSSFIFYNGKCPLSNWNTEYPFKVGHTEYICVEQYVMEEKAYNFGDSVAAQRIREETNPRAMKRIGKQIRNYDHQEWLNTVENVTYTALKAKFNDPQAAGAREYLLETGERRIGEANIDAYWGTGVHHLDPKALTDWSGGNALGNMLVAIRKKIVRKHNEQARPRTEEATKIEEASSSDSEETSEDEDEEGTNNSKEDSVDDESLIIDEEGDIDTSQISRANAVAHLTPGQMNSTSSPRTMRKAQANLKQHGNIIKPKWVVALGDSNLPSLIENPCENIPVKIMCIKKHGMKLHEAAGFAKTCLVPKEDVDQVLVHLATTSWHYEADISAAQDVYKEYETMLTEVSAIFPHAKLIISGVIQRDTTGQYAAKARLINVEIGKLNKTLKKLADDHENLTFIPNDDILPKEQGGDFFSNDTVHLSSPGSEMLLKNLKNGVRESLLESSNSETGEWRLGK